MALSPGKALSGLPGSEIAEPIEVTAANRPLAEAIVEGLVRTGHDARMVTIPENGATVILTEGTAVSNPVDLSWTALERARRVHSAAKRMIFLQAAPAPGQYQTAGLFGLARTLRQEWPLVDCVCWSLELPQAETVIAALSSAIGDAHISQDRQYYVPQIGGAVSPPTLHAPVANKTWLVTGGGRGITARCAIELAKYSGGTFLLAGRSEPSPWPARIPLTNDLKTLRSAMAQAAKQAGQKISLADLDRAAKKALAGQEIAATVAAISEAGGHAHYIQLDLSDQKAVALGLAAAQNQHGQITGLIHGAGILADRLAIKKTRDDFAAVFEPKIAGLHHILATLDIGTLSHVGLFSSAAAAFGNPGQADYATANACLDSFADRLALDQPQTHVKSFAWGPWDGGMVDESLAQMFAEKGIALIDRDDGARIFAEQLLFGDRAQVRLLIGSDWTSA